MFEILDSDWLCDEVATITTAVALPNELIGHLIGPVGKTSYSYSPFCFCFEVTSFGLEKFISLTIGFSEGKRHDAAMLADSNFLTALEHNAVSQLANSCVYTETWPIL